jgi:cobalt-zinc-cadmium efflux system outer membrane protein
MQILQFLFRKACAAGVVGLLLASGLPAEAQQSLTWEQIKAKFEAANPTLQADEINVQEMKAEEITAFLRPNPGVGLSSDGLQLAPHSVPGLGTHWMPLTGTQLVPSISYLHEREHKRELRLETAKEGTQIAGSQHEDLDRNLLFNLRSVFVQTLQAKAVLELAKADLEYYDKIIEISRSRFKAGDIAQIDLDRIELLRVQYEAEIETATVDLRTSKIQLMQLINERTPIDQFDLTGSLTGIAQCSPWTTTIKLRSTTDRISGLRLKPFSNPKPIINSLFPMVPPIQHTAHGIRIIQLSITRLAAIRLAQV